MNMVKFGKWDNYTLVACTSWYMECGELACNMLKKEPTHNNNNCTSRALFPVAHA